LQSDIDDYLANLSVGFEEARRSLTTEQIMLS